MKHLFVFAIVLITMFVCCTGMANAEPANTYIYVTCQESNTISVINPYDNVKVAEIITDSQPDNAIINSAGTLLYVTCDKSEYVSVFSTIDFTKIASIKIRDTTTTQFTRLAMSDNGKYLYVSLRSDQKIIMIDATTNQVLSNISTPYWVGSIYYNNGYLYATQYDLSGGVAKYNGLNLSLIATVPSAAVFLPSEMAVDTANNRLIVANENGTLTGISLSTFTFTDLYLSGTTNAINGVTTNNTGYVFITRGTNTIGVISPTYTPLTNYTIEAGSNPIGILFNPYNYTLFVCGYGNDKLYVVNANTGATITSGFVGNAPYHVSIGTQAAVIQHQVKFVVQSLYGLFKYDNVTVTVYDNDDVLQYSQKTDTSGQVAFYLQPTVRYTINANSTTDSIDETITVVPYDDIYYFNVFSFFAGWNPFGWAQGAPDGWTGTGTGSVTKDVRMNYSVNTTSSPRIVLLNYSDATASTTAVNFTLLRFWQTNGTYTVYNTTIVSGSGISYRQQAINVTAADADGQTYQIVVTGTTGAYGSVKRMDSYRFPGAAYPLPGLPTSWYPYIALGVILLFGLFFTYLSSGLGLVVMAFWGIVFMYMGWLTWNNAFMLLLQVVAVFGVGQIFKMKRQREGV